jgi:DHA2 family methylenomycin A resistance protein-like MFS transporter
MATWSRSRGCCWIDAAPPERAGIAAGVLNAARQTGSAVGIALLGALLAGHAVMSGLHAAMAVTSGSFLVAAVAAGSLRRRQRMVRRLETARVQ